MGVLEIIKNKEYRDNNKKEIIDICIGSIGFILPVTFIFIQLFRLIF